MKMITEIKYQEFNTNRKLIFDKASSNEDNVNNSVSGGTAASFRVLQVAGIKFFKIL